MNDDYQNAIRLLPLIGRHRADDTSDWRTICIALKNCGVPYEVFEEWSLTPKYQDKYQIRRAWQNLTGNYAIGTLCYYAKLDHGVLPELSHSGIRSLVPQYLNCQRQVPQYDGEKAFAGIIRPYREYSESDLECELFERSPYRLTGENEFSAVLESLYAPEAQPESGGTGR